MQQPPADLAVPAPEGVGNTIQAAPLPPRPPARKRRTRAALPWVVRVVSLIVFIAAWQVYAGHVSKLLLASPSEIAQAFGSMVADGSLPSATGNSLVVLFEGFGIALVIAVPAGMLLARFTVLDWAVQPYVSALVSTPLVALVPLYVLWFGLGQEAQVAIVASFSFFPLLLNTYHGAKNVDPALLDVARSFGASQLHTWRWVVLPSAIPYVAAGVNLALGHALSGLIIAELYTNASGLGALTVESANTFQTPKMFAPIIVVMALGITLMALTRALKRTFAPWAENTGQ
jgi:NitT/TauT family transport system permease protein